MIMKKGRVYSIDALRGLAIIGMVLCSALANGNSKMYHSDDMARLVAEAGLEVEELHDNLGLGHSIMVCRKK